MKLVRYGPPGKEKPGLTVAQATELVAALNSVEWTAGCADADPLTPRSQAEQDMLALVGTLNGMGLDKGLANDLRTTVRDAGKQIAEGTVPQTCKKLAELGKKIAEKTGKKNGLTTPQAAQLSAARAAIAAELGC